MTNVGIDVSKARLDVAIRPTAESFSVANDESGHKELRRRLLKLKPERIVLEPTGGYESTIVQVLAAAKLPVAVVNALRSATRCSPTTTSIALDGAPPASATTVNRSWNGATSTKLTMAAAALTRGARASRASGAAHPASCRPRRTEGTTASVRMIDARQGSRT